MWKDERAYNSSQIHQSDLPVVIKSPHRQAWAIPEKYLICDYPVSMTDDQLLSTVLMIWREYILHDEVLSAIKFLENAPYRIRDHHSILEALSITRSSIEWMNNDNDVQAVNIPKIGDSFINDEIIPLTNPLVAQIGFRYNWVTSKLPLPNLDFSIIDFGSLDGVMTNRWGKLGVKQVVGIDFGKISTSIANQKASQYNTGVIHYCDYFNQVFKYVELNSFDFASCCDAYEHLIDHVNDLIKPAYSVLKKGGYFITTTPYGSWTRGNIVQWAYPWCICNKIDWLKQNRTHLIAPSVWSNSLHLKQAGFRVRTCITIKHNPGDVPDQGNVATVSIKPNQVLSNKIFCIIEESGAHLNSLFKYSILGANIKYFSMRSSESEGIYEFIECYDISKAKYLNCDILIASSQIKFNNIKFKFRYDISILDSIEFLDKILRDI